MNRLTLLLGLAKVALVAGLVMMGIAGWAAWRANSGGGVPKLRDLTPAGGLVVAAREVTIERRNGSGGSAVPHRFFELDLQTETGGAVRKLRVDHAIGRERLEPLVNRRVIAHYDRTDLNTVYALQTGGSDVFSYGEMVALLQGRFEKARAAEPLPASLFAGLGLCLAGAAGIVWRRRLRETAPS